MKMTNRMLWATSAVLFALTLVLGWAVNAGHLAQVDAAIAAPFMLTKESASAAMIGVWQWISWAGGGVQRYVIVAILAVVLGRWTGWRNAVVFAITAFLSNRISDALKDGFGRDRPDLVPHLDHVNSMSYPSGHATSAAVVYILFVLLAPVKQRALWFATAALLIVLNSWSRMALGVHWPTDVLGGTFLGASCAFAGLAIARKWDATPR